MKGEGKPLLEDVWFDLPYGEGPEGFSRAFRLEEPPGGLGFNEGRMGCEVEEVW